MGALPRPRGQGPCRSSCGTRGGAGYGIEEVFLTVVFIEAGGACAGTAEKGAGNGGCYGRSRPPAFCAARRGAEWARGTQAV